MPRDDERSRIEQKLADRVKAAQAACERAVAAREPAARRAELATDLLEAVDRYIDYVMRDVLPWDEKQT